MSFHTSFSGDFDADVFSAIEKMEKDFVPDAHMEAQNERTTWSKRPNVDKNIPNHISKERQGQTTVNGHQKSHPSVDREYCNGHFSENNETVQFHTQIETRGPTLSKSGRFEELINVSSDQISSPLQVSTPNENFRTSCKIKPVTTSNQVCIPEHGLRQVKGSKTALKNAPALNLFQNILGTSDTQDEGSMEVNPPKISREQSELLEYPVLSADVSSQSTGQKIDGNEEAALCEITSAVSRHVQDNNKVSHKASFVDKPRRGDGFELKEKPSAEERSRCLDVERGAYRHKPGNSLFLIWL